MTLNFLHPYGESGDTPPNLNFTRGESIEERRKALNEAKQRVRVLVEAAKTGNVWYVVAIDTEIPMGVEPRRSAASVQDSNRPSASAVVFANIENRCISVFEFKSVALDAVSPELRALLGEKGGSLPTADNSASQPP
jgi:hypothetical protein